MAPRIEHILVPTDFSLESGHAIEYATTLAASLGATVHLVHVLQEPLAVHRSYVFHLASSQAQPDAYEHDRARLVAIQEALQKSGVHSTAEVRTGNATSAIVKAAIDYGADLIVMSTHGRRGLEHLLVGSVAEDVIRRARCPVLAIRAAAPGEHEWLEPQVA